MNTLTRYIYTGPQSAASLRVGDSRELLEVQLHTGESVELPAGHEYTLVLLELKHLVLAPNPTGKALSGASEPKKEAKPNAS
ncbi:hypothetical protein NJH83_21825 [Pseudomonas chlororaphis]|uniref:hypothetical protein n=1 Tax=Pseudomonas chlororaphis TaxID=587753 RepID=UPI00209B381B|nr:hypothetical protein [Pseudomonas chlororaphis]MCO7612873.1 hypothetical protein [Pseudomonas chlororaphis]